ncbi:hypothetical protein GCM10010191_02250 [Actinomadura vinacea]|uniref:Sel1 repeat family protein n=1 Tax=Actinomadura vinacea TaxID=115336 RepID=A0ABN3IA34_9ACTN
MIGKSDEGARLDGFVQQLVELREACGSPSLRDIASISKALHARDGDEPPRVQELSATAISDVLARRRERPPAWHWVASYVLSCQAFARHSGARADDPAHESLPDWHRRYRAALPPPPGTPVGTVAGLDEALINVSVAALIDNLTSLVDDHPGARAPDWSAAPAWHEPLSMTERRYGALFGTHGIDLLNAAEEGNEDAACRLGLLLLCEDRTAEGLAWLESAAAAGDIVAQVVVHSAPQWRTEIAAQLAYELTLPGYGGDPPAWAEGRTGAEAYYRGAARSGHPGATYRLALMLHARGDDSTAAHLFGKAARLGHPEAAQARDRLRRGEDAH